MCIWPENEAVITRQRSGGWVGSLVLLMLLAGCAGSAGSAASQSQGPGVTGSDSKGAGGLAVAASFYPLAWLSAQVGGDAVTVSSLTGPGVEPHDLELTPQDVAAVGEADLVVFLSGFQPAVDEAVNQQAADTAFDAAEAAQLTLTYTPIEEGEEQTGEAGAVDPHFWLDPMRLADVGDALARRLGEADPGNAATFATNAEAVRTRLATLDAEFTDGLASCANRDLVTSHNAFGYLAEAYDLIQIGITGLTPEAEPSPADLSSVTEFVRANEVTTIYYETLIGPDIAQTVANETGARTAVLDPLEGLNSQSPGEDYLEVMLANLASLKTGQPCP
jgi:zinc transport system substrate-binding protein